MSLIKCPECKKKVSDQTNQCPNCGRTITDADKELAIEQNKKSKKHKKIALIVIIVMLLAGVAGGVTYYFVQENNKRIEELRLELRQRQEPDDTSSAIEGTRLLLDLLEGAKPMLEFDPSLFRSMVKKITVYQEKFCFQLANGLVLEERRAQS